MRVSERLKQWDAMRKYIFLLLFVSIAVCPAMADYKQAVAYYTQGDFNKAIQELKEDIVDSPDWEFGHRLVGLCYLNIGNYALAVSSLQRAVELKSTAFATYYGLGQAYFNMKRYNDAIAALDRSEPFAAREEKPDVEKAKINTLRGTIYYITDRFSEAVTELQGAIRVDSSDWELFFMTGASYFNTNRDDDAIKALEKAAELKPDEKSVSDILGKAYFRKGVQALSSGRYNEAIRDLGRARTIDPDSGYINYNLGEAYVFEKRYAEAERELVVANAKIPDNAGILTRLGFAYERQDKNDLALKTYRRAYDLSPSPELKEAIDRVVGNAKIRK